jgi:serine phosphatase RsbU (regulator of sigma subunit)
VNFFLTNYKNYLVILLLSIVTGNLFAQTKNQTIEEKQALFIYNFSKYTDYPNFDQLSSFTIGVIGEHNNLVVDELEKITQDKTVRGLPIKIKWIHELKGIPNIQLIYFDTKSIKNIDDIYTIIQKSPVLLVAKGFPYGRSMINFIIDEDKIKFELNETKIRKAHLKISKVITMLEIHNEKEWANLLDKIEAIADSDQKKVEITTKDLDDIIRKQKELTKEIKINTQKLNHQKEVLKKQTEELTAKEELIKTTKAEIDEQKVLIENQLIKISNQQINLQKLNSNVEQKQADLIQQQKTLNREAKNLIAIKQEYLKVEIILKEKETLVSKQDKKISTQNSEIDTQSSTIKSQKSIIWLSIIFLIIVSALGIWAYRSYRLKNEANRLILEQKGEIEQQHFVLEEQHKEITDSINYAKRIQDAILPPLTMVREHIPDSFILYKPKDIVAGDFYWLESVTTNDKEQIILFAAADCTGHGVPGAMVSIVCHNSMNRAVREFNLIEPHQILDKTRELVVETFEKSHNEVHDGMDIALCSIDKTTNKLIYAGANNGLYLIRNHELIEYKPDKQPIGNYHHIKPFNKHEIQLKKGDVIYMYTDGYADQFGGEKGKKFKYKPFKELLLSIHNKPLDEQHELMQKAFIEWQGNLEQIDDVCIIGMRL